MRDMGKNVNFLILGRGEEEARIRTMIGSHALQDRVKIKNDTPHREMAQFWQLQDVVLLIAAIAI